MEKKRYLTNNDFLKISNYGLMKNYPVEKLKYNEIDIQKIKNNDIIFIKSDFLNEFNSLLKKIDKKIILISGNSDLIIDDNFLSIINNKNIIKWYAVNSIIKHDKMVNIPLGLQNEHLYFYNNPQSNQKLITNVINENIVKNKNVLLSFNIKTNILHRKPIYDKLKNKSYIDIRNFKRDDRFDINFMMDYYREIKKHKFVICPLGNGPDCHRYWEVLYLGSIPIIQKHPVLDNFFENDTLPVLYIDDISKINKNMLDYEYNRIKSKEYDLSRLYFDYWEKTIK